MARGVNSCSFIGNLGSDPEVKEINSNTVANVNLATTEEWGSGDARQSKTEWIPLVFWGKPAELVGQYCRKGSKVYVSGRFQTRSWQDKEGNTRYKSEINVRDIMFLDAANRGENATTAGSTEATTGFESFDKVQNSTSLSEKEVEELDLPF
jgi:single-strand DNA-binding protein